MSLTAFDTETNTKSLFKRKATPFYDLNHVVAVGYQRADGSRHSHYFGRVRTGGWLVPILEGTTLLAGHNIKFDIQHAMADPVNRRAWMDYVNRGGMIWDTQLAEYLLGGMGPKHQMLSLEEVAVRYGGNPKLDAVKELWEAGVETEDIDKQLLLDYLVGYTDDSGAFVLGDIGNTALVAKAQIQRARECGQLPSIMLNMGALLFTIEAEFNGVYADRELGLRIRDKLVKELAALDEALNAYLPDDLPFQFKWTNRYHLSPLIFGGVVNYDSREYDLASGGVMEARVWDAMEAAHWSGSGAAPPSRLYAQKTEEHIVLLDGTTVAREHASQYQLTQAATYASGLRAGQMKTKQVKVNDLDKPKGRIARYQYTFPGVVSPGDREKDSTGLYSVNSDTLEELAASSNVPFLKTLGQVATLTKDIGTYYLSVDPKTGEEKGMLSLVGPDGIIHHKLHQDRTVTGRLSSSDPNLQNVSGEKSEVKTVLKSRFGDDGKICQSDFSSLEVYTQGILTKCQQLLADLRAGLDMHVKRVAAKEHIDYREAVKLCKGYIDDNGNPVKAAEEWVLKRKHAKTFSFQRAYGAGAAKIAWSTGMPIEEVKALIEAEERMYPEVGQHYAARTEQIKANRRPTGEAIPHPELPGVFCHIGESYIRTPDGKLYSYRESPAPAWLVRRGEPSSSFSPTEIKNYEVQGTGGEWAKAAMYLALREFYRNYNWDGQALLINQVHDAIYGDFAGTVAFEAAATLHACMQEASAYMEWWFNWELPIHVPTETKWGPNMKEEHSIDGIQACADVIRADIRQRYMQGYVTALEKAH